MPAKRLAALFFLLMSSATLADHSVLRVGTTTSTQTSGLMDALLPVFRQETGYETEVKAVGTGAALKLGQQGKVDVLLVHAPQAEQQFIADGHGLARHPVMRNAFIIVGPADDPAGIAGFTDVAAALRRVKSTESLFLSRGDDSGTHKKELALWRAAGIDPYAQPWYHEIGAGIGNLLRQCSADQGYTLVDRGTWLALRDELRLRLLVEGDTLLDNPYAVIAVNPARHPDINAKAAQTFVDWLLSPVGQHLIGAYRIQGETLYAPERPGTAEP